MWDLKYYPDFLIGFNGAELYDSKKDEIIQRDFLSAEEVKEAFNYMKPFEDITNSFIYYHEGMLFEKMDQVLEKAMKKYKGLEDVNFAKDKSILWSEGNGKVHFRCLDAKDMPRVEQYIKDNPHPYLTGAKTQADLMEIFNKNVSKGNMVKDYCARYDISLDEVAAFGDTSNDNSMLEIAGLSVCLLNGSDDTKEIAQYVTEVDCDHEGFAKFIEKNILN